MNLQDYLGKVTEFLKKRGEENINRRHATGAKFTYPSDDMVWI